MKKVMITYIYIHFLVSSLNIPMQQLWSSQLSLLSASLVPVVLSTTAQPWAILHTAIFVEQPPRRDQEGSYPLSFWNSFKVELFYRTLGAFYVWNFKRECFMALCCLYVTYFNVLIILYLLCVFSGCYSPCFLVYNDEKGKFIPILNKITHIISYI